jgi:SAM-dependent methyltransferase
MSSERAQRAHYDRLAADYVAHYQDAWSQRYRDAFIDAPLLAGLDLRGRRVLEAMCGSGATTAALRARGARVTGLDVSPGSLELFRRQWPDCDAVCASITHSGLASDRFDAAVVVGGLHHLHPEVEPALAELHRVLRPGGMLCFMEPHAGSLPDWFRRRWYRWDPLFLPNEAAIDVPGLAHRFADRFAPVATTYGGNVAFLLVANSMVFRIPPRLKGRYSPALLRCERWLGRLQGPALSCFAVCQWRKREGPTPRGDTGRTARG